MLAYVFWHWPRPDVAPPDYERLQQRFHQTLAADAPAGFLRSGSAAIRGAPWANWAGAAYEDWYLVRDSAALDPLNEAAVAAARRGAHDQAAALAEGGTAGLFRLRLGSWPEAPREHLWFAKPAGMGYGELWERLAPCVQECGGALWGRQMTLGPSPELCLQAERPVQLPLETPCVRIAVRGVWPLAPLPQAR